MTGGGTSSGMMTPCGLGIVLGPFFSREGNLTDAGGCCWLLEEEPERGAAVRELTDLQSLGLKEVERNTRLWASLMESL